QKINNTITPHHTTHTHKHNQTPLSKSHKSSTTHSHLYNQIIPITTNQHQETITQQTPIHTLSTFIKLSSI
ncbi:hypothetical protein, partial [Bacillus pumilus]|uniref:hypothetical protein n=1 Tax=Bacillus pumilus TaxID=1408 RepID=UPI001C92FF30